MRLWEVYELRCCACKELVQIVVGSKMCPKCNAHLTIEWSAEQSGGPPADKKEK